MYDDSDWAELQKKSYKDFMKNSKKNSQNVYLCWIAAKKGKTPRKRATRLSVVQMIDEKSKRKTELKARELEIREKELALQKQKFQEEAEERKEKFKLEMEERRMFMQFMRDRL